MTNQPLNMFKEIFYGITRNAELIFWPGALLLLFFMTPAETPYSFCAVKWLGIPFCPGCGIGHSIHYALHLQFSSSIAEHYFGIPAVLIILHRIYHLIKKVSHVRKQFFYQPGSGY